MTLLSRVWDKKQKKMIYDFFIDCDGTVFKRQPDYYALQPQDIEVMYAPGLKDKDDKVIYAGDIVAKFSIENIYFRSIVVYRDGAFGYFVCEGGIQRFISFAENHHFGWKNGKSQKIKIVGNIYEKPVFVKEVKQNADT
jgi:uncharacterized phage protein (TIGR01671 family)